MPGATETSREFEAASFRDGSIAADCHHAAQRRMSAQLEAALLLGGDARQLAPAGNGEFFSQSVRRELGLRTRADGERELRRDLELLLASVPRVVVTWQAMQDETACWRPNSLLFDVASIAGLGR